VGRKTRRRGEERRIRKRSLRVGDVTSLRGDQGPKCMCVRIVQRRISRISCVRGVMGSEDHSLDIRDSTSSRIVCWSREDGGRGKGDSLYMYKKSMHTIINIAFTLKSKSKSRGFRDLLLTTDHTRQSGQVVWDVHPCSLAVRSLRGAGIPRPPSQRQRADHPAMGWLQMS